MFKKILIFLQLGMEVKVVINQKREKSDISAYYRDKRLLHSNIVSII